MARETLQGLKAQLADTQTKLYAAWDYNRKLVHLQPAYGGALKLMVRGVHVGTLCEALKGCGRWLADVQRPEIGRALCIGIFPSAHAACREILKNSI